MDIKNLATKPQLVKVTLDDTEIVELYGYTGQGRNIQASLFWKF